MVPTCTLLGRVWHEETRSTISELMSRRIYWDDGSTCVPPRPGAPARGLTAAQVPGDNGARAGACAGGGVAIGSRLAERDGVGRVGGAGPSLSFFELATDRVMGREGMVTHSTSACGRCLWE